MVACEGSLGVGNAALTVHLPDKDSTYQDAYQALNGQQLGDIFQSITRIGNRLFLCINNSDQIICVDQSTLQLVGKMSIPKPRYILRVSDNKAYVSTLFSNKIYVVDPQALTVSGSFTLPHTGSEEMLLKDNKALVALWDTANTSLYVLNPATDAVDRTIPLPGAAPQAIAEDSEGKIWVLSGNVAKEKAAHLCRLDASTGAILADFPFPAQIDPIRLEFNPAKDTLYFIEVNYNGTASNGVYRMGIHSSSLPSQPFVAARNLQYFWGVGIEPSTGLIYIADPKGFTQRGAVSIYNAVGDSLHSFNTGVGPGHFYFEP